MTESIKQSVYFFTITLKYGGIAQLGERLNGIQEVSGSIPLISTNATLDPIRYGSGVVFCTFYRV